jgi:hypothetical protein
LPERAVDLAEVEIDELLELSEELNLYRHIGRIFDDLNGPAVEIEDRIIGRLDPNLPAAWDPSSAARRAVMPCVDLPIPNMVSQIEMQWLHCAGAWITESKRGTADGGTKPASRK